MATQVIRYVDPDATGAGNGTSWTDAYTSLAAWDAAEAKDLVTADEYHTVYCRSSGGTADATTCFIAPPWDTDATRFIEIYGYDFPANGIYDPTKYKLHNNDINLGYALVVQTNNVHLHNLQVLVTKTGNTQPRGILFSKTNSSGIYLDSGIIVGSIGGPLSIQACFGLQWSSSSGTYNVFNTTVYGFVGTTGCAGVTVTVGPTVNFYNCTAYNNYLGFSVGGETIENFYNCISGNNTDDFFYNAPTTVIDYCCSDDGDGSHAQGPKDGDWTHEFINAGIANFALRDTGNCAANGVTNPGSGLYLDDITGKLRTAPWSIGAFETGGNAPKFHHYNKNAGGC